MFAKHYLLPSGAATEYHALRRIEARFPLDDLTLHVASYTSHAEFLSGRPALWETPVLVPIAAVGAALERSIEAWVTTDARSPFAGGTITQPPSADPLLAAKERARAILLGKAQSAFAKVNMDASMVEMTAAIRALRDRLVTLRSSVDAATTVAAVEMVVW